MDVEKTTDQICALIDNGVEWKLVMVDVKFTELSIDELGTIIDKMHELSIISGYKKLSSSPS